MSEIRLASIPYERCKHQLISFRNSNRETQRSEAYFDWRYLGRPGGLEPVIVWAENAEGRKVGSMSIIPHHYLADNATYVLGVLGDISVADEYRGKGIAKQMLGFLSGLDAIRKLDGCIVLPNVDAARPLEKAGWTTVSRLERHIKFLNVEKRLKRKLASRVISVPLNPLLNYMLRVFSYETLLTSTLEYSGGLSVGFDSRFDTLWNELKKDRMVIGFRNREYLSWRYSSHPVVEYRVYTLTSNLILCGYIVFHYEGDTCYIDDFLCKSEKGCPVRLMSCFLRYIKEDKLLSSVVLQMSKNDLSLVPVARFGFLKRRDYQGLMINFNDESLFMDSSKWYLTAGDKDV
jgi:GNAT superfamily N-acetyltransferase